MPNRLIRETSPYLLQHAHNPVDWFPWGSEALNKAQTENKPIFLSIGYAACHWCHVMEHESFQDADTAALLNQHFVPIKVDREERPDLDAIYMNAVVAMTGQGGWPMSVFLTPDAKPFYGGTYFPNTPRHGMPAFRDLLHAIAEAWKSRQEEIQNGGAKLLESLQARDLSGFSGAGALDRSTLAQAVATIHQAFDWTHGGWDRAPKFPQPMTLEFLLRRYTAQPDPLVLQMVTKTLDQMARGGIYDQLGGGFHRYSTDDVWLVPHFEKMLYDNAQLARVYLHAWQVTHNEFYRRIAEETLDYIVRDMTDPHGGFYSSEDADSEGEEGKFYVWTPDEIRAVLGEDAAIFMDTFDVTAQGNFEGKSILRVKRDPDVVAAMHKLPVADVEARLANARNKALAARALRVRPGRDNKVLTAWNGLMLAAFAEAARMLRRDDYRVTAERNADFLLTSLRAGDGRLRRSWKDGDTRINAYLEDYANLAEGLLALYETTFDTRWFSAARELTDIMLARFADPHGGMFDTSDDHETLVVRPKGLQDNAVPSGNAMGATVLLKMNALTGDPRYGEAAERALRTVQRALALAPLGFAQWLSALDFALAPAKEIAIVGSLEEAQPFLNVVYRDYRPNQVVAVGDTDVQTRVPLLEGRTRMDGRATAYVCENFACQMPVTQPEALESQLTGEARSA